ncbi:MAG: hypothetical protein MRQ09_06860 [Candidatus Midichloria sp.]|nr:hypothetical protein [Candidatus Midichloria sp.]
MANGIFELSSLLNSTALGLLINGIAASGKSSFTLPLEFLSLNGTNGFIKNLSLT